MGEDWVTGLADGVIRGFQLRVYLAENLRDALPHCRQNK